MRDECVVICGAGPTGLGAAWRLEEHRRAGTTTADWVLFEQDGSPGGMARSERTAGFVWDLGGHVLFSHYEYFDRVLDAVVHEWDHVVPVRGAWMWGRFIPYPVQRNLRHFPPDVLVEVLAGLRQGPTTATPTNFEEFLIAQFGSGLYKTFFLPLNRKMWATHPSRMDFGWADQRSGSSSTNVPRIDLAEILADIASGTDALGWTFETRVRYPAAGGTGRIWSEVACRLPAQRMHFNAAIESIATQSKTITLRDGRRVHYDHLVSTMPLDRLLYSLTDRPELTDLAGRFRPARAHVVGVGMSGVPPESLAAVCSLYIPDEAVPFWRLTVLSNYSRSCVPGPGDHWSLLCEVNVGDEGVPLSGDPVDAVIDALVSLGFIDRERVVSTWHRFLNHGYPVPVLGRDDDLGFVNRTLEHLGVYSRGRFGGWRYEVSNQDHAFMQGVEIIDRLVNGASEVTYPTPARANAAYNVIERRLG